MLSRRAGRSVSWRGTMYGLRRDRLHAAGPHPLDHLGLVDQSLVAGSRHPLDDRGAHPFERGAMGRLGGDVLDLMGIAPHVVELFGRARGAHPQRRGAGELARGLHPEPLLHDRALVAIDDVPHVGQLGGEVADVEEARVAGGSHHVVFGIHAIARREDVGRRRTFRRADQRAALHVRGNAEAGEGKNRWREVDEADQLVADRARRRECPRRGGTRIISGTCRPES